MSDIMEQMWKEAVQEGIRKGVDETKKANALRMLANGKLSLEEIAELSGLSLEEVKKLQKDTNV